MRIEEIHIEQYGTLRQRHITLAQGLTLVHGANEAGKSTLLSWIRTALFGSARKGEAVRKMLAANEGGRLLISHDEWQQKIWLDRMLGSTDTQLRWEDGTSVPGSLLSQMLHGMSYEMYRNLFAFSLTELEQIRSLQSDEINAFLFATGTGLSPAAITKTDRKLQLELDELYRPRGQVRAMNQTLHLLEEHAQKLRRIKERSGKFNELTMQCEQLEAEIEQLEQQREMKAQKSAWLERCAQAAPKWVRLQELQHQLNAYEQDVPFPEHGLMRYERLLAEASSAGDERMHLEKLQADLKERLSSLDIREEWLAARPEIERLLEQLPVMQEQDRQAEQLDEEYRQWFERWKEAQQDLALSDGTEEPRLPWIVKQELEELSRQIQDQLVKVQRHKEEVEQVEMRVLREKQFHQRQQDAREQLQDKWRQRIPESLRAPSLQELKQKRETLLMWHQRWQLHQVQDETLRTPSRQGQTSKLARRSWVRWIATGGLIAVPIYVSMQDEPVLGWMSWGLWLCFAGWQVKEAFSVKSAAGQRHSAAKLDKQRGSATEPAAVSARELGLEMAKAWSELRGATVDPAVVVAHHAGWLQELDQLIARREETEQEIALYSRRLHEIRLEMELAEEQHALTREHWESERAMLDQLQAQWQQELHKHGLPDHLSPQHWTDWLRRFEEQQQLRQQVDKLQVRREQLRQQRFAYEQAASGWMEAAAAGMQQDGQPDQNGEMDIETGMQGVKKTLHLQLEQRAQQTKLEARMGEIQEQLEAVHAKIARMDHDLTALHQHAGVQDEEGFRRRATEEKQRSQLLEETRQLEAALYSLIPEEERGRLGETLRLYRAQELMEQAEALQEQLAADRQQARDKQAYKGRLQLEIEQLMDGEEHTQLQWELERLKEQYEQQLKTWVVKAGAQRLIQSAKVKYERERQPEVIRHAAQYFRHLTAGRYEKLFAPLGEQRLIVEREDGVQFEPAQLSRGTAEQLYLSLRFAMIRAFRSKANLPIILDDIMVNFDPERIRLTCQLIASFSQEQQVLFLTCHPHLSQSFQQVTEETRQELSWISLSGLSNPAS
ncbi:AAA family ATPase [Marinicrinis sediminis]|uniref:AAA family ATPase n=1 Tax=Marinicrinis sediminis TaxID=1652465 RepID=A0ABW5R7L4_9BACL